MINFLTLQLSFGNEPNSFRKAIYFPMSKRQISFQNNFLPWMTAMFTFLAVLKNCRDGYLAQDRE